ncbi:MAG: hypothetical protein JXR96_18010 [Deltaproteobacteria bacterium]|nr:hypothetical protein [Deltaproteobacteria bacterium]
MRFARWTLVCLSLALLPGCGTYSVLRPADTLEEGSFAFTNGVAANSLPEAVYVAQASVGLLDWLELDAQYEVYSALGQLRFGVLHSEEHGVALALSAGGGAASLWDSLDTTADVLDFGAITAGVTIGRRWAFFELYGGWKGLLLVPGAYFINTAKLGFLFTLFDHFLIGLEGGCTAHHSFFVLGEGAVHLGFKI